MKRTPKRVFIGFVILVVTLSATHLYLLDGLHGWLFSMVSEEDTLCTPGYSDWAFRKVEVGMTMKEVSAILGPPLDSEYWHYCEPNNGDDKMRGIFFNLANEKVTYRRLLGKDGTDDSICASRYSDDAFRKIQIGMTMENVLSLLGSPLTKDWGYCYSPGDRSYKVRRIEFTNDRVSDILHDYYVD